MNLFFKFLAPCMDLFLPENRQMATRSTLRPSVFRSVYSYENRKSTMNYFSQGIKKARLQPQRSRLLEYHTQEKNLPPALPSFRVFVLAVFLLQSIVACSSGGGAAPPSPVIERPEITSHNGGMLLQWDISSDGATLIQYDYQQYRDDIREDIASTSKREIAIAELDQGEYEFRIRACISERVCSEWSTLSLNCERENSDIFCWQALEDTPIFALAGRAELDGEQIEVWDSILITTDTDCKIPIRAFRRAGISIYKPLVHIHGGGWQSMVNKLSINGGSLSLYDYQNTFGIAKQRPTYEDLNPEQGSGKPGVNFNKKSDLGILVNLLNEDFMVFDVEYSSMNASGEEDKKCEARSQDLVAEAALVVEKLYDPNLAITNLPVQKLANSLPILMGESAGGQIAHSITTHHPEKVLKTVNISGPLSWSQYLNWRMEGIVKTNFWYDYYLRGTMDNPVDREEFTMNELLNAGLYSASSHQSSMMREILANSPDQYYNQYDVGTPPVYYVSFAYDVVLSGDDPTLTVAQADYFCNYISRLNNVEPTILHTTKTGTNSRRLIDCGDGNVLDQYYDDPNEPDDHLELVTAHVNATESQLDAIMDWLRYGVVTTASY